MNIIPRRAAIIPKAKFSFPKNFLWGTATSSHQVEGNNTNNNWHQWENTPGKILKGDRSGLACDWWGGRWKEDLTNAARDGQNTHRFSVEWSRIQPAADKWDEDALNYYREMIKGMKKLGFTPMLTLHHYTDPLWVVEQGWWQNEKTPELFAAYVRKVVSALKDQVDLWITINEPFGYMANAYVLGAFPPGKGDLKLAFTGLTNLVHAHANAYHIIHELQPQAKVGFAHYYRSLVPAKPWFPPDVWETRLMDSSINRSFPNALVDGYVKILFWKTLVPTAINTQDFVGVNYYSRDIVSFDVTKPRDLFRKVIPQKNAAMSETGYIAHVPEGMMDALKWAHSFKLPIYVTEAGVEDSRDTLRPRFLFENIHQVWRAVNFNWDVKGYFHWSQVDNFEWERGWTQRFGLWGLDLETRKRIRRKSVDIYASICKENGISSEMVEKFVPEILPNLFPG
ncbi:MAG: family 1 glycosylhydrolase [bacterium]